MLQQLPQEKASSSLGIYVAMGQLCCKATSGQPCGTGAFPGHVLWLSGFQSVPQHSLSMLSPELGTAFTIARHTGDNISCPPRLSVPLDCGLLGGPEQGDLPTITFRNSH